MHYIHSETDVTVAPPEFALERGHLSSEHIVGLRGLVELALQLAAGGSGALGLLLRLLHLPLQLLHANVGLLRLQAGTVSGGAQRNKGDWPLTVSAQSFSFMEWKKFNLLIGKVISIYFVYTA